MPTCNICLENATHSYSPPSRPPSCRCNYTVHQHCYNTWLEQSNMAYNCIICHTKSPVEDIQAQEPNYQKTIKLMVLAALSLFLLIHIRKVIIAYCLFVYAYAAYLNRAGHRRQTFLSVFGMSAYRIFLTVRGIYDR